MNIEIDDILEAAIFKYTLETDVKCLKNQVKEYKKLPYMSDWQQEDFEETKKNCKAMKRCLRYYTLEDF